MQNTQMCISASSRKEHTAQNTFAGERIKTEMETKYLSLRITNDSNAENGILKRFDNAIKKTQIARAAGFYEAKLEVP